MLEDLRLLGTALSLLRTRPLRRVQRPGPDHRPGRSQHASDAGYSTEAILVTALLVAVALTALGILTAKIVAKANSIDLS